MLKLGNINISKVYIGSTPAPKGFLGEVQVWGQSTPVETIVPDFVVNYFAKSEGETLEVARGGYTDIIDKVGRYNSTTGQYEVIEYGLDDLVITVEENEPFQYGFTLKNKTVMDMMPFSDNMDVREIDLHTLTTLRKLTGSIASPYSRDPNDFFIDLPNTVQRFEDTPCVCATVRIWDNGAYRYGLPSSVTYIGMPEGREEDEGLGGGAFDSAKLWSGDYSDIYEFIIPASVTHLEKGAFANAQLPPLVTVNSTVGVPDYLFDSASFGNEGTTNLIDIKIAEGNTSVGDNAFMVYGDTSHSIPWVYSLSLPSTLRTIGDGAFAGMMFSVGLDLPNGLTTIGEYAFTRIYKEEAYGDLEITIPASVTTIGAGAFNSSEIKALHFNSTTPATFTDEEGYGIYPFDDCHTREEDPETHERKPTPLYVPCEAVDAYKTAWSMYEARITCDSPAPYGYKAKLTFTNGDEVEIPKTASTDVTITNTDFDYDDIVSAVVYNGVTTIGNDAFGRSSITAITLPNTLTAIGEYAFQGCSSLTSITIPNSVTTIGLMAFVGCTSLISVTIEATTPAALGNDAFYYTNDAPIYVPCEAVDAYKTAWAAYADRIQCIPSPEPDPAEEYFHFISLADGSQVKANSKFQYSLDGGNTWTAGDNQMKTLASGATIHFKGTNSAALGANVFGMINQYSGIPDANRLKLEARGNILSLIYGDSFRIYNVLPNASIFKYLFADATDSSTGTTTELRKADNLILPSLTLTEQCYRGMFAGNMCLESAPDLPATQQANRCYQDMFNGCTLLSKAPLELPLETIGEYSCTNMFAGCGIKSAPTITATSIGTSGCSHMFSGCTSLTAAPELPATTLNAYAYDYMFFKCSNMVTPPSVLPATTVKNGANGIYLSMFGGCTKLASAPEIKLTTLGSRCCELMFQNCKALKDAPTISAPTARQMCFHRMYQNCTGLTGAPELPATTLDNNCYYGMFSGCTSLQTAPELPATTLANGCYSYMFNGCTNLNYVKAMFTTTPSNTYTEYWLSGIFPVGTFVKNSAATWDNSLLGLPNAWTVQTADT